MTGQETYERMASLGLAAELTEEYDLRVYPKKRLNPTLRDAIREHKAEIVCRVMQESFLTQAAEHYGLELDTKKMPPASPEKEDAIYDADPDALLEALYEYVRVWRCWPAFKAMLENPAGGVILDEDAGALWLIEPEDAA
jgi:hypothetical protein